jgi:NarL family two-component system response regulator LiaR
VCRRARGNVDDVLWARQRPDVNQARAPGSDVLTDRGVEVLVCVAKGWSNSEIADHLYVTAATAKTHVARLLPDGATKVVELISLGELQP